MGDRRKEREENRVIGDGQEGSVEGEEEGGEGREGEGRV